MLSRFVHNGQVEEDGDDRDTTIDGWHGQTDPSSRSCVGAGDDLEVDLANSTDPNFMFDGTLTASVTGNVSSVTGIRLVWAIIPENDACADASSSEIIGSKSITMGTNNTFRVSPPSTLEMPSSAPFNQTLKVCAYIDFDQDHDETKENDNAIATEHRYVRESVCS